MQLNEEFLSHEELGNYIPQKALTEVWRLLEEYDIGVKAVLPRRTLQGSYRIPREGERHSITVNSDLNPYVFLITLLHEIAHTHTWVKHKSKGHKQEWKGNFERLLIRFIELGVFPKKIKTALEQHLEKIAYSDITDIYLTEILRQYNTKAPSDEQEMMLKDVPKNAIFSYNGKNYRRGERLRKYISCRSLEDYRMYRCHPLMMVSVVEEDN